MSWIAKGLQSSWQTRNWRSCLLLPVAWLYGSLLAVRRQAYVQGWLRTAPSPLPVVVVGNLSVGGTGKTPLCAALVERFQQAGWTPAIVSRGYGGRRREHPHLLNHDDTAASVGDEPLMLFRQSGVPVCVCTERAAAVACVAQHTTADIVFSDDGLQHLAMARACNIVVIDGLRGLGNRWLLPAGPLREPVNRLATADLIVIQRTPNVPQESQLHDEAALHASLTTGRAGKLLEPSRDNTFQLLPRPARRLTAGTTDNVPDCVPLAAFRGKAVHAVAGIGHPQRFFDVLQSFGLQVKAHSFPDHHPFTVADVSFDDELPILVTTKDAVKLAELAELPDSVYEVGTTLDMSSGLSMAVDNLERSLRKRFKA